MNHGNLDRTETLVQLSFFNNNDIVNNNYYWWLLFLFGQGNEELRHKTFNLFIPNKAAAGHKHYKSLLSFSQVCCLLPQLISYTKKKQIIDNNIDLTNTIESHELLCIHHRACVFHQLLNEVKWSPCRV